MENQYFYTEELRYLNHVGELEEGAQRAIDYALSKNGAVGVAGGYYEEGLPLQFVSNFMIITLGYDNEKELAEATDGKLLNIIWPQDRKFFEQETFIEVCEPRIYRVLTKTGEPIWVSEVKKDSTDESGKRKWIISLRNIDIEYKREESLKKQSADLKDTVYALSRLYHKVLKVNLTTDSFKDIKAEDQSYNVTRISDWTENFVAEGNILEEDIQTYLRFCDLEWLRKQFKNGEKSLSCRYRRLIDGEYHWVKMEFVTSAEYRNDNQVVILCIVDIEEDIRKQNEIVVAVREAASANTSLRRQIEITKSLGSFYFSIYSIDLKKNQYTEIVTQKLYKDDIPSLGKAEELLKKICETYVTKEYQEEMLEFFRLDTLCERIGDAQIISHVYKGVTQGWCRDSFIVEHRDRSGRVTRVTYASQNINNEMPAVQKNG